LQLAARVPAYREMYIAAPIGDRVVEGYVDLLLRTADGLVIVDYKTDRLADDRAVDERAEGYRIQLAAYAAAVEAATGEPVVRGVLVFAGESGAMERVFERSALGVEAVPALLAGRD
jgi:ATP-dependent helicase/nuclease subunit A